MRRQSRSRIRKCRAEEERVRSAFDQSSSTEYEIYLRSVLEAVHEVVKGRRRRKVVVPAVQFENEPGKVMERHVGKTHET